MQTRIFRFFTRDPADTRALETAVREGRMDPREIVAIIGKTEGNGAGNDFSRGLATLACTGWLAAHLGCTPEEAGERVVLSFSGGTEGIVAPHLLVFAVSGSPRAQPREGKRLAVAVGHTRPFLAAEAGGMAMVEETARAVHGLMAGLRVEPGDVHLVQVKGAMPVRGPESLDATSGCDMAGSRAASALGVGLALGEIAGTRLDPGAVNRDWGLYSTRASVSAKPGLARSEICLFANSAYWDGDFAIAHDVMEDILDVPAIYRVLARLGLHPRNGQLPPEDRERLVAIFAKSDADPRGTVRGRRHTMWSDGDISDMRHSRCVVSSLLAGVTGETAVYVSTRAEHQGPPGGGPVALIGKAP